VQARVHTVLRQVRQGTLDAGGALLQLQSVETGAPRYSVWTVVIALGIAAAALARLLGGDVGAMVAAGVSSSLALIARREMARLHFNPLALPFASTFLGAILGGLSIRMGWTQTPELALVVPALTVIPGTQLINALLDLLDSQVAMSAARFTLATAILLANALGLVLGIMLMLSSVPNIERGVRIDQVQILPDVFLSAIATCGFAVLFNVSRRHVGLAALGGFAGHAVRLLALHLGLGPIGSTFLGGLVIGLAAKWMARAVQTPIAVIAFAGAVTMIPGLHIYRALGLGMRVARLPDVADTAIVTSAVTNGLHATLVVGALGLGLVIGVRAALERCSSTVARATG
jgi:uncharacterized membrane protein YjjB (DUF3815 family)